MLSPQALQNFKEIWERENGETISDDFALEQAINLLTIFDVTHRPIKKEWEEGEKYGKQKE
jgi:hypothetical protein